MARNDWLSEDEKYLQAVKEVQQSMDRYKQSTTAGWPPATAGNPNLYSNADPATGRTPYATSGNNALPASRHNTVGGDNFMVDFAPDAGVSPTGAARSGGTSARQTDAPANNTTNAPENDSGESSGGGGGGGGGAAPSAPSYTYNPSYGAGSGPTMSGYYDATQDPQYMAALQALQVAQDKPPAYVNSFEGQLADLYDQIVNRDKFKYDLNADMLYQQYKNQYMDLGQQAMRDTMGQAAGLTGGYGSTYAQNVGQQAYQSYLQRLNDVAPELYDRAFNTWLNEGNEMVRNYGLLQGRADDEYQKYLNDYNQWAADRAYAQDAEQLAYNRGKDQWATQYGAAQDRAKVLASYGDYSGYANLYGGDAANALQRNWIYDNPDLALRNGLITQEEYNALVPPAPVYYGGGGGDPIFDDEQGDDNPGPKPVGLDLHTYSEAVAYLRSNGVSNASASSILTEEDWSRLKSAGSKRDGAVYYDTYQDYLNNRANYMLGNK